MRTSPIHYIAPSSIEITPNANNSYNDLAVYIAPVTDIKVYCPRLGIGTANGTYSVWQLYGRNRRLNDSRDGYSHTKAYTIYARLSKADSEDGYIVFTPKQQYDNKWYDKYSYITKDGLSIRYNAGADSEPRVFDDANYWYVKLGEVSAADSTNQRTVDLDTGILGTDQWNSEWALNPDALPLNIDMEYRLRNIADEEWDEWTAITRYVRWNQVLHVKAQLIEGWTGTDINRFHHWEITRDTGNADADGTWNEAHNSRDGDSGDYTKTDFDLNLVHLRGIGDDFNSVLQALFTLTAYELNPDYTAGSEEPQYLPLISSSFSVIAETVETFDLEESSSSVTYNPQTGAYVPAMNSSDAQKSGVTIRVRATDADGKTFYPTTDQINTIGLHVYCRPIDDNTDPVAVSLTNGRGTLPSAPFLAGKSVEVWLQVGTYSTSTENIILSQKTITYIRFGETGPAGGNTATVMLYKRSSDAITSVGINTTLYYKFSTPNKLYTDAACTTEATSSNLNDWSLTIPNDSTDPIYVTAATTYSNTESDDITSNEWVTPAKYTENGAQGAHGVNTATIFLYKRSQNAISSHGITAALYYKFSDGKLYKKSGNTYTEASDSDRNNWLLNIPASDGNPCYVIQAAALSTEDYDQIATTDWSGVRKLVEDGKNITKQSEEYRYAVTNDTVQPTQDGSSTGQAELSKWYESKDRVLPLWTAGKYFWTKTIITWSDTSKTNLYSSERNPYDGKAGQDIIVDGATVMKYYVSENNAQHPKDDSSEWKDYSEITLVKGKWLWAQAKTNYKKADGSGSAGFSINYNVSYIGTDGENAQYIYLKGTARDANSEVTTVVPCEIKVNGGSTLLTLNQRGLNLVTINRQTLAKVDEAHYDTYGEAVDSPNRINDGITNLIAKLNSLDDSVFVCLVSYDAIGWSSALITALQGYGMGYLPYTEAGRYPFLFIGYKNLGAGNGLTRMLGTGNYYDVVELSAYVANGALTVKDGKDGENGRSIVRITEYYKASALDGSDAQHSETAPVDGQESAQGWSTDPNLSDLPAAQRWNEAHKYLWNYEKVEYSSAPLVERTTPQILAIWTKDGAAGKGIDSIQNYYKVTDSNDAPSRDDEGWTTTPQAPGQGEYLWNYEKITWINPAGTTYTDVQQTGYAGTDGQNAIHLDLDNEHEDMLYSDSQTLPIAPSGGATSAIHLYDGSTEVTSGFTLEVDFTKSSGVPGSLAGNRPIISNGVLTVPHITADTAKVVVKAFYNDHYYFAEFTANKIMQDKYDLQLTPNSIPYNPSTYPSGGVTIIPSASRTDLQGNITSVNISTTESEGNVCLYWALVNNDGTHGNLSLLTTASFPASGSTMAASGVYFELRKLTAYVNGVWQYRMCDYDTVPFTKAENGTPADVWTIDSDGYWCKNGIRYEDPTTHEYIKAEGKDGTGVEIKDGVDVLFNADITGSQTSLEGLTGVSVGECYTVTANKHLYFYDGTTAASVANPVGWRDLGKFSGDDGLSSYVHIAYADNVTFDSQGRPTSCTGFTTIKQKNAYDWVGLCTNNSQTDPTTYTAYEWNKVKGAQGEPGADAVNYKVEFTDNTFALDPNTNKSVIYIKGVVYRTEGSNTPTQVSLTGQDLVMRFVKNDGTTQELYLDTDFGIQNNEFVTYAGSGSVNTNFKTFIVEYKPDGQNILARGIIALTVYGEKGMEAIRGYADYLYSEDDTGSRPGPGIDELGKIDLLQYSDSSQNRVEICETSGSSYVWKGYGKTDYPDGTMFVCKIDNHIYRASATGWVDEGRFKGDNAVVYKIDFTDSTFAYNPNTARNVVDIKGVVYKIDGGNTSVFTRLATDATLKLYFLLDDGTASQVPSNLVTISNGAFSTTNRTGAASTGEKNILAVLEINNNEVARANIPITVYATNGSRGKRGRSYYYAQPWEEDPTVSYLVNDSVAPYFYYNGEYYVYNPVGDIDGPVAMSAMGTPSTDNPNWEIMQNDFKYIITEAIFGKYADFGSFRITGNWLYSELGEFLGENTEDHPNILHKLYDFRKSYPDDVTEVNLPACNYIHPEDPNITYVEIYDDSEESGSTIPTVTTKTNILTDDDDAWQNLKSGVIYSFSAYFANCKFYLRKNRVKRASIVLYKRSSTTISAHGITTTLYYKFSDGKLYTKSGNVYTEATDADLNNWKLEKPADNGNTCYIIQAAALGAGDYDQIQTTEWSEANILHLGDQVDVRYVRLYKRSSSAVTTVGINTALYYKFSDGKLYTDAAGTIEATSSDLNGWSLKAPTGSTDQLYLTAAIANRYNERDKITSTEWVTPTPLTFDDLTLMSSASVPASGLVYFELAEDGEYQFIVEKYNQSESSSYLNWVRIREHYFLAYIAINGRNGYILQRNSHGNYNGTGNFTSLGAEFANIDKMHSGDAYDVKNTKWIDIDGGILDISRYSKVRIVGWNSYPSGYVNPLGYVYVDSSGALKVSSIEQDFYNPNKGNIPAT